MISTVFINPFTALFHKDDSSMLKIGQLPFFVQQEIWHYLMLKCQTMLISGETGHYKLFANDILLRLAAKELIT